MKKRDWKKWSEQDITILKENYGKLGASGCSKLLNRSKTSIYGMVNELSLITDIRKKTAESRKLGICKCKDCGSEKPFTNEYFPKSGKKDQLTLRCIECTNILWRTKRTDPIKYIKGLYSQLGTRHREKGFKEKFLSVAELLEVYNIQGNKCAITGLEMTTNTDTGRCLSNISVDRIDSKRGYTKGNVQFAILWANIGKSNLGMSEFINYCKAVINYEDKSRK